MTSQDILFTKYNSVSAGFNSVLSLNLRDKLFEDRNKRETVEFKPRKISLEIDNPFKCENRSEELKLDAVFEAFKQNVDHFENNELLSNSK